jgi:hypothetical protein
MIKPDVILLDFGFVIGEMLQESWDDCLLDLGSRNPGDRSELGGADLAMQAGLGDIVAVAHTTLGGVRCDHAMAGIVEQQILQEVVRLLSRQVLMGLVGWQLLLGRLE